MLAACDSCNLVHVVLYDSRDFVVIFVARLAVLEEHIRVLVSATGNRLVRVHGALAEFSKGFFVQKWLKVFLCQRLNLLDFVRCAETVEEVQERKTTLDSTQMSYGRQIHDFLNRAFSQYGETGLAASHNVLVVAKDTQCVRGQCASCHVEHAGQQFAGNLIHVRYHEEQALRGCVGGCECASLKRTVHCTGSATFTLHFLHCNNFTKYVFATGSSPLVHMLSHW